MEHSKKLVILEQLLMRLTGQAAGQADFSIPAVPETGSYSNPHKKRLEILQNLLRLIAD